MSLEWWFVLAILLGGVVAFLLWRRWADKDEGDGLVDRPRPGWSVHRGILGWSNDRAGVEFYVTPEDVEGKGPRWAPSTLKESTGKLLVEKMDPRMEAEGRYVLVLMCGERGLADVGTVEAMVRELLA
jgi:hypothetical protein